LRELADELCRVGCLPRATLRHGLVIESRYEQVADVGGITAPDPHATGVAVDQVPALVARLVQGVRAGETGKSGGDEDRALILRVGRAPDGERHDLEEGDGEEDV